ncbi:hypothetical protein ACFX13_020108 [Malus domestica]
MFGWTILNTYGSVQEIFNCGGLLLICSFISKAPNCNIFIVELWAICKGMNVTLHGYAWVEFGLLSIVKMVNREQAYVLEVADCLRLPALGCTILNTDVSVRETSCCGGLLRRQRSSYLWLHIEWLPQHLYSRAMGNM